MAQTRVLILGGGGVTTEYYLPALQRMGRLDCVAVVEPDAGSRAAIGQAFGTVKVVGEGFESVLDGLPPPSRNTDQYIVVALPNPLHVDAVERAMATGRHVLCEKPLALVASDCERLVEHAAARGVLLKVAMSRRYLPTLMLVREIIRGGELGSVRAIEVRDRGPFLWRPRSFAFFAPESGGILADMGVHYLDYIDALLCPMTPIAYEDDARGGTESSCCYRLAAGAADILLRLSRVAYSDAYIRIECERGEIKVEKGNEAELTVTPKRAGSRRLSLEHPFDNDAWPKSFQGSFCQMLTDFERAIAGAASEIADGKDAARSVALIEWAYRQRASSMPPAAVVTERPRALVTGATGFIGGHLVERLTAAGDFQAHVRVAVRSPGSCANIARFPIDVVPTDLLDIASVRKAVTGVRTVYHLAFGKEGVGAPGITIEGTKNVVKAAIEAGAECVVVLSTMYVFGFPDGGRPVDETFPYRPYGGEYAESKTAMERWCLSGSANSGRARIVVLNPTCVIGPAGGAYTSLPVELARRGEFCWISGGTGLANYTYVENTIDAILAAATTPEAHGQRFIVNDGTVTWRELIEPLIRPLASQIPSYSPETFERLPRFGGPFRIKELVSAILSAPEVRSAARRSPILRRVLKMAWQFGSPGPGHRASTAEQRNESARFPPDWLNNLFPPTRSTFSAEKAKRVLKWSPRIGLAQAHAETIRWLIKTGRLPESSAGADFEDPA